MNFQLVCLLKHRDCEHCEKSQYLYLHSNNIDSVSVFIVCYLWFWCWMCDVVRFFLTGSFFYSMLHRASFHFTFVYFIFTHFEYSWVRIENFNKPQLKWLWQCVCVCDFKYLVFFGKIYLHLNKVLYEGRVAFGKWIIIVKNSLPRISK